MNASVVGPRAATLGRFDALVLLAVAFVWGTNFAVMRVGLDEFSPFLFATLRFALTACPLVFFFERPALPTRWLVLYGIAMGCQFGLLFLGLRVGMTPGLASLLMQAQVFLTVALAWAFFHERLRPASMVGIAVAALGLALIALHLDAAVTGAGIAITLAAALCWAFANLVTKYARRDAGGSVSAIGYMAWSSVFALPPLVALTALDVGFAHAWSEIRSASWAGWSALAWQTVGNTLFGYGMWNVMLGRHAASAVTPFALLIPVFGLAASAWWLGEALPAWKLAASALVLAGLVINNTDWRTLRRRAWR